MTSAETLNIKVAANELSFLLVTHTVLSEEWFGSYGHPAMFQGAEWFWDSLDIGAKISALGPKMSEAWKGSFMDLAANLLGFSTPTHTHNFGNHSNGYGCSKTALMRRFSGLPEIRFFNGLKLRYSVRINENYNF
jgi:hypothetical protein